MNKTFLIAGCVAAIMAFGLTFIPASIKKHTSNEMLTANIEALTQDGDESGNNTTHYKKTTGDCTIEASAGATVELKLAGIKIASAKSNAAGFVTFKDVRIDCEINGTYICKSRDCADFYVDIIKAAKSNNK